MDKNGIGSGKYNFWLMIVQIAFISSLISYLLFYLIESNLDNFIESFYNLNYHLAFVIVTGIVTIIFKPEYEDEITDRKPKILDYLFIAAVTIGVVIYLLYRIKDLGWLSYLISLLSGLIILLISYTLLKIKE